MEINRPGRPRICRTADPARRLGPVPLDEGVTSWLPQPKAESSTTRCCFASRTSVFGFRPQTATSFYGPRVWRCLRDWRSQSPNPTYRRFRFQGPKSPEVIEGLFGERGQELSYYEIRELDLDGIPVMLSRSGWSGEVGFEIFLCNSRYGDALWERVMEAGRPHGIVATGPSDIRRFEAGILGYGCDISLEVNPYEAGLDWDA